MLTKIRDFMDTTVPMVILFDDITQLEVLAGVIVGIGRDRFTYEVYKDTIAPYMMELRMPYNCYLSMMKGVIKAGYNFRPESKADIFNRMFKEERP